MRSCHPEVLRRICAEREGHVPCGFDARFFAALRMTMSVGKFSRASIRGKLYAPKPIDNSASVSGIIPIQAMPLQLRLTHSLGERLIDLEPTTADHPHMVGQSTAAQVEIPSSSVAKRHSLLFVRDGQWYVHDAASPTGTLLNG